jgi:hypothetical protein
MNGNLAVANNVFIGGSVGFGLTTAQFPVDISGRTNIRGNLIVANDVSSEW